MQRRTLERSSARGRTNAKFLVCIHDATPAYARETEVMIRDLAPLIGRRISFGVVPNWHGDWPLSTHPEYCRLLQETSEELLLHGYFHHRQRGWGPISLLAEYSDEMNGLDAQAARRALERGQRVFAEAFGKPARGFLAPAWQRGQVRLGNGNNVGLHYIVGFFAVELASGQQIPLATSTWDCGQWGALGHLGHGIGWLSQSLGRGVPALAIHPRDLERGFWAKILRRIDKLLETGHEPTTPVTLGPP